jgi:6-pyruvoyltetrahydropterin/6-carboxytetrahydropterin synthase
LYTLSLQRDFTARHYLIGGNWGAENSLHAHAYRLEFRLQGDELDTHGFLVDLVQVEAAVETILARVRDRTLNELPEFSGLNPSLEHFARITCMSLDSHLPPGGPRGIEVRIWEDSSAWASYHLERK